MMDITNEPGETHVSKLNSLLCSEMSAYMTYEQAKDHVDDDIIREQLIECENSHRERVHHIRECIEELGAEPMNEGSIWASYALLTPSALSDRETVSALESEEDLGLKLYQQEVESASEHVRDLMLEKLLPAQEYTHDAISILKFSLQ